jgi:hypothetical protein
MSWNQTLLLPLIGGPTHPRTHADLRRTVGRTNRLTDGQVFAWITVVKIGLIGPNRSPAASAAACGGVLATTRSGDGLGWSVIRRSVGMARMRDEARRYVKRKRTFYTVLVVYVALVVLWFVIDVQTGSDDWWSTGDPRRRLIVAIVGVAMFGVSGLFGAGWEQREMERYLERHPEWTEEGGNQR